jgi:hypothetical protein
MTLETYRALRYKLHELGYEAEYLWAQNIKACPSAYDFWCEFAWVVLNAGMKEQVARGIWQRVRPHVEDGGSAHDKFGHKGKASAIDRGWAEKWSWFDVHRRLTTPAAQMAFLVELPWIGDITKFHLAKNLGVDCAKPDRHLARIAGTEGTHEMCERLARVTGDRIATVDVVIWRAANLGLA